jgi:hypothetical protein
LTGCGHNHHGGHRDPSHTHSQSPKADGQDIGAREVLKHLPSIVAEELAKLKEENRRLRKILVQRDLEISAIRNQRPQKN